MGGSEYQPRQPGDEPWDGKRLRKLRYRVTVEKTWPDREDLSEPEPGTEQGPASQPR